MTAADDMNSGPGGDGWTMLPWGVMRQAGYPLKWADRAADGSSAAAARELLAAEREVDASTSRSHDPALRKAVRTPKDRKLLRAVQRRRVPDPALLIEAPDALRELAAGARAAVELWEARLSRFDEHYRAEELAATDQVISLFRDQPGLRDVLLVSNEGAYDILTAWIDGADPAGKWNSQDKQKVNALAMYLQRVCAKNDSVSHFGPFSTARLSQEEDGVRWSTSSRSRSVSLSRWATESLAELFVADHLDGAVRPRRAPGAFLHGDELQMVLVDYRHRSPDLRSAVRIPSAVHLEPADAELLRSCDGERTVIELTRLLRQSFPDTTLKEVTKRLWSLHGREAVRLDYDIPFGTQDSLTWLEEHLPADDTRSRAVVGTLQRLLGDFRSGSDSAERRTALKAIKAVFQEETGRQPNRGQGAFYSDRAVLHEDCPDGVRDLVIGRQVGDVIRRELDVLYNFFLLRPRNRLVLERRLVASWFEEHFATERDVPVNEFLQRFLADADVLEENYLRVDAELDALQTRIEQRLLTAPQDTRHRMDIDPAAVRALLNDFPWNEPALCNPDVMISAESPEAIARGELEVVVGDLHAMDENLSHGMFSPFLDRHVPDLGRQVVDGYRSLIRPDEEIVDLVLSHRNKHFLRARLPCTDVEVQDRSPQPRSQTIPFHQLVVVHTGGELRLRRAAGGPFLRFMSPPLGWLGLPRNPFSVFGFPTHGSGLALPGKGRAHLPRVQMGRVVVQRETWRVAAERLTARDDRTAFLQVQRLRRDLDLPRRLYVRLPGELKLLYCDLDSPLLVRQVSRLAGRDLAFQVEMSEMMPGPEGLWLRDDTGRAYTSELRCSLFSPVPHPS